MAWGLLQDELIILVVLVSILGHKESTKQLKLQNWTVRFGKSDTPVFSWQKLVENSDEFDTNLELLKIAYRINCKELTRDTIIYACNI
jgi:hypothetical protein